jgi:antitoxin HicB
MRRPKVDQYPVEVRWSDEDDAFIAEVYDLPGCLADGETEATALRAANEAARLWIETAIAEGRSVPSPSTGGGVSGKFNVRLPASLHRELQRQARREGVSLNQLVLALLARRGAEQVGPYHVHKTRESAINEAETTGNCYVVVDRSVVARHGLNFMPHPWRPHGADQRTGAVFFEHPQHVADGRRILEQG